mmetsp:Transcript_87762/g.165514  ORF Transcript_87762/g.165514 Transcript_87762/m.165514 type:complete len:220 (-) Transcript_87762:682-1341(-)
MRAPLALYNPSGLLDGFAAFLFFGAGAARDEAPFTRLEAGAFLVVASAPSWAFRSCASKNLAGFRISLPSAVKRGTVYPRSSIFATYASGFLIGAPFALKRRPRTSSKAGILGDAGSESFAIFFCKDATKANGFLTSSPFSVKRGSAIPFFSMLARKAVRFLIIDPSALNSAPPEAGSPAPASSSLLLLPRLRLFAGGSSPPAARRSMEATNATGLRIS